MKKSFEIITLKTKQEAAAAAGEALNALLQEHKKFPLLLLLSGGSALEILDYVGEKALGENLTMGMLDERFSQNPEINNFLQMQKTEFYALALNKDANFFGSLPRPGENMEDFAKRFEKNLINWKKGNPRGKIFIVFGIGPDGHTAGIFPDNDEKEFDELFTSGRWAIGYDAANKHAYNLRVTATLTFFKQASQGIGFACGSEKKSALKQLKENSLPTYLLPVLGVKEMGSVKIFTDI